MFFMSQVGTESHLVDSTLDLIRIKKTSTLNHVHIEKTTKIR